MKNKHLMLLIVTVLVTTGLLGTSAAADFTIRFGHQAEVSEPLHQAALRFAERVEERTNGNVTVSVFPAEQIGNELDRLEQVRVGAVQMVSVSAGGVGEYQPEYFLADAPFMWDSYDDLKAVYTGPLGDAIRDELVASEGMRVIAPNWYWGERHVTSNRPIRSPADVANMKLRVPEVSIYMAMANAWGASATPVAFAEVYTALQQGVVDGQENPLPTIWSKRFFEVQSHISLTAHMTATNVIVMNEQFYQSLPDEYKQIVEEEILAAGEYHTELQMQMEQDLIAQMQQEGATFVEDVDREAFRQASLAVHEQFADVWGEAFYQDVQEFLANR
jgi:tripartite ATP-independent transporter DctP family solute receptor